METVCFYTFFFYVYNGKFISGKYLAPEMLGFGFSEDDTIDPQVMARADIFSLGISIFELV